MKKFKLTALALVCMMIFCLAASIGASAAEVTFKTVTENGKIYGLPAGSTCAVLKSSFYNTIVDVSTSSGTAVAAGSTTKIGTGFKVRINGTYYTAVVLGDTDGDGAITAADYILAKRAYLGTATLEGVYLEAAGVKAGEALVSVNYIKLKRACLGTYNINVEYTCDPYTPGGDESGWTSGWV